MFLSPSQLHILLRGDVPSAVLAVVTNETRATMLGVYVVFRTGLLVDLRRLQLGPDNVLEDVRLRRLRGLREDSDKPSRQANTHVEQILAVVFRRGWCRGENRVLRDPAAGVKFRQALQRQPAV